MNYIIKPEYNDDFFMKKLPYYTSRALFEKYKSELSLKFCFMYLYNNAKDKINDRVYYNEICNIYRASYSLEHITKIYNTVEYNKQNDISYKQNIYKIYCKGDCSTCDSQTYCF